MAAPTRREKLQVPIEHSTERAGTVIDRPVPTRRPGSRLRRLQRFVLEHIVAAEAIDAKAGVVRTDRQRELAVLEELSEVMEANPAIEKHVVLLEPTSTSPARADINPWVELRAILSLGVMQWWWQWMLIRPPGTPGTVPQREGVLATLLVALHSKGRPEIKHADDQWTGQNIRHWSVDYLTSRPGLQGLYKAIETFLHGRTSDAAVYANVELVKQLGALTTVRGKLVHPDIGRYGVVDATKIPAWVSQDPHPRFLARLLSNGLKNIGWVVYRNITGQWYGECNGYKLVVISCVKSTLPLAWTVVPADADEREAAAAVLQVLFAAWPYCPMEYLIGDGLYMQDEFFCRELLFRWALHPVFPAPTNGFGKDWDYGSTGGVPRCCKGTKHMRLEVFTDFMTPAKRAAKNIKRGEWVEPSGRLRWVCPDTDRGGCGARATTRPGDNARIYTKLPHQGPSDAAALRKAMLLRRNSIESIFASIKHWGIGRAGDQRPRWADDVEHLWVLSTALLLMTARRLAWETGLYQACEEEARRLGFFNEPTLENPNPGPTPEELARVRASRRFWQPKAQTPSEWPKGDFWVEYQWLCDLHAVRREDRLDRDLRKAEAA